VLKGFLAGFGVCVLLVAAMLLYRSYYVYCPCGFKYDPFSGGCVVDLNSGPCTDKGGGNTPGSNPSAPGKQTAVSPPNLPYPPTCPRFVSNCGVRSDWKAVEFTLVNPSGTIPKGAPPKDQVTLSILELDKNGGSCGQITGGIDVPYDVPQTIPFDGTAFSASYPGALSSSTSGTPPGSVQLSSNDGCRVGQVQMVAFPTQYPACGCKGPFFRG
jgi:hypothetical protein